LGMYELFLERYEDELMREYCEEYRDKAPLESFNDYCWRAYEASKEEDDVPGEDRPIVGKDGSC